MTANNNQEPSPGSNAEQKMSQLRDIFRISAITVKEMPFLNQLFNLSRTRPIVISRTQLYDVIA